MKMLISHAHGKPASTTATNTIYYVWAKRGREKLKLKYAASTWQVGLMPNGTLHTKQKTLDKFLTEAKSFPNIMFPPTFGCKHGYCGRKRCNFPQAGKGD